MKNTFIDFYFLQVDTCSTKEDIFTKAATESFTQSLIQDPQKIQIAFQLREQAGNTMIAENFALPHIENEMVHRSGLLLIQSKKAITWQRNLRVKTILFIFLKPNEAKEKKIFLANLMKKLAYEETIKLLETSTLEEIHYFLFNQTN